MTIIRIVLFLFVFGMAACQKNDTPTPDPVPDTPKDYLVKMETEWTYGINPARLFKYVDSFYYNETKELIGIRRTSYTDGVVTSVVKENYRRQGNQLFFPTPDGIELRTATLDPLSGYITSLNHLPNYSLNGKDSVFYADDRFEYDAIGFLKKHFVRYRVVNKSGDIRLVLAGESSWDVINDGKNITRKTCLINNFDSAYQSVTGSIQYGSQSFERHTYSYKHTADAPLFFVTTPYRTGKQDLNLVATETVTVEVSSDKGATWTPIPTRTSNRSFVHDVKDGLLQKTTIKSLDYPEEVVKYFYEKR